MHLALLRKEIIKPHLQILIYVKDTPAGYPSHLMAAQFHALYGEQKVFFPLI